MFESGVTDPVSPDGPDEPISSASETLVDPNLRELPRDAGRRGRQVGHRRGRGGHPGSVARATGA